MCPLQPKVILYIYGIYLTMHQKRNLRRSLKNLGLSSIMASKLEVIRSGSVSILCVLTAEHFLKQCLSHVFLVSCSRDSLLAL